MRCRKVRFYLSAYCHDELSGLKKHALDKHLTICASCRKEEAIYRSLNQAGAEMADLKVSEDFNNQLLNRIAHERFAETRTKAYFPNKAPLFLWKKAIPAVVSVCLVLFVSITFLSGQFDQNDGMLASNKKSLDDSYLTVQPTNNPNMTVNINKNWSFRNQLARAERINNISRNMIQPESFTKTAGSSLHNVSSQNRVRAPYVRNYYKIRPVIKVYLQPESTVIKGGLGEY